MVAKKKGKWKDWYSLLITFPISVLGVVISVFFGHKFNEGYNVLGFFMSISFPACIWFLYFYFDNNVWYLKLANAFIGMIILIPFMFLLGFLQNNYTSNQLNKYPVTAYGKVTELEIQKGKHTRHNAIFEYSVNGKDYMQRVGNENSFYQVDDSVTLVVSEKDPEIFKIVERIRN